MPAATVRIDTEDHPIGAADCAVCWGAYPKPCDMTTYEVKGHGPGVVCPGLIHAEYGDESSNGDYYLTTKCDVCGAAE